MNEKSLSVGRSAILDTNLVLLALVADTDQTLLHTYKRVQMFTHRDMGLLRQILKPFSQTLTTPYVLTEVSNFLGQAPPYAQIRLQKKFAEFVIPKTEIHVSSAELVGRNSFFQLGLTDCALEDASAQHTIITTDYRLAGKIQALGRVAINFNHARAAYLLS